MSDDEIVALLAPLRPITEEKVPFDGDWRTAPFSGGELAGRTLALLCDQPDLCSLVVDQHSGEVLLASGPAGRASERTGTEGAEATASDAVRTGDRCRNGTHGLRQRHYTLAIVEGGGVRQAEYLGQPT